MKAALARSVQTLVSSSFPALLPSNLPSKAPRCFSLPFDAQIALLWDKLLREIGVVLLLFALACGGAELPLVAPLEADPNDTIWFDDPNAPLMMVESEDEEVCGITREWVYYRGAAHKDKSCEEYSAVLAESIGFIGWHNTFFGVAICWLMDPCSKGQP